MLALTLALLAGAQDSNDGFDAHGRIVRRTGRGASHCPSPAGGQRGAPDARTSRRRRVIRGLGTRTAARAARAHVEAGAFSGRRDAQHRTIVRNTIWRPRVLAVGPEAVRAWRARGSEVGI